MTDESVIVAGVGRSTLALVLAIAFLASACTSTLGVVPEMPPQAQAEQSPPAIAEMSVDAAFRFIREQGFIDPRSHAIPYAWEIIPRSEAERRMTEFRLSTGSWDYERRMMDSCGGVVAVLIARKWNGPTDEWYPGTWWFYNAMIVESVCGSQRSKPDSALFLALDLWIGADGLVGMWPPEKEAERRTRITPPS